jgi:SAM-dependent methyltransferase
VRRTPAGDYDYEDAKTDYSSQRCADPRIGALILEALGDARTVINVGAGAGSYEPLDRYVTAIEPSAAMRAQRPASLAPAIDAVAEALPFDDDSFDAALASITVHQWRDADRGLRELRRVSRGPVAVLTFDPDVLLDFWLAEYVPEVLLVDQRRFPSIAHIVAVLGGGCAVSAVPIACDCTDGFGEAYYGRPEAFLDPTVRASQSGWGLTDAHTLEPGLERLRRDLASGAWDARHGHLRSQPERVGAVRLVVAKA